MVKYEVIRPLRGFRDILPPESEVMAALVELFRKIGHRYGYVEIIPPTLEHFELFAIKSGEEIRKSMFVFQDKAGREVALRPEVTASIARAYSNKLVAEPKPLRLMYIANCFRYEEPQRDRYREFYQAGAELLGLEEPLGEIEILSFLVEFYSEIGLTEYIGLKIGDAGIHKLIMDSLGIPEKPQELVLHYMDKKMYDEALSTMSEYARLEKPVEDALRGLWALSLKNTGEEFVEKSQMVIDELNLPKDVRDRIMQRVNNLAYLAKILSQIFPQKRIDIQLGFARGLAYYTGVIFEVLNVERGISIAGGGRYDELVSLYSPYSVPATGFAIGIDRTISLYISKKPIEEIRKRYMPEILLVVLGRENIEYSLPILKELHTKGLRVVLKIESEKHLRRVLNEAVSAGYNYLLIIGDKERDSRVISVRNLRQRSQEVISISNLDKLVDKLKT